MMMYSIYDKRAVEYGPLFAAKNDAVAERQFNNMMHGEKVLYPTDYALYCVGDFDTESGVFASQVRCVLDLASKEEQ